MQIPRLPSRTFIEPRAGAKVAFSRTFTEADMALFIGVTWDVNPYHTDESFASQTKFGKRIVPGLLTASMLTHIGGLWAFLATQMNYSFLKPVYVGQTITAQAEIVDVDDRGRVTMEVQCHNDQGEAVLSGTIQGIPGRFDNGGG